MKLWLDDCRPAPEGWVRATTTKQAKDLAEKNIIEEMSLDHDLGTAEMCEECSRRFDSETEYEDPGECRCACHRELAPTGYDFVKWMLETGKWPTTKPVVHSANPVGAGNMRAVINRYWFNPQLN
jgi:hypothetical protein